VRQPNSEYMAATGASGPDWAVHDFWKQMVRTHAHDEFVHDATQEGYGIGVVYLDPGASRIRDEPGILPAMD
jgi:hypothetical protein